MRGYGKTFEGLEFPPRSVNIDYWLRGNCFSHNLTEVKHARVLHTGVVGGSWGQVGVGRLYFISGVVWGMFGPRVGSTLIRPTRLMGPAPYTKYFPVRNSQALLNNVLSTIQYFHGVLRVVMGVIEISKCMFRFIKDTIKTNS